MLKRSIGSIGTRRLENILKEKQLYMSFTGQDEASSASPSTSTNDKTNKRRLEFSFSDSDDEWFGKWKSDIKESKKKDTKECDNQQY